MKACVRCREERELHRFRAETETHCMHCLRDLCESSLLAWLDLFTRAGVDPGFLGGAAFGIALDSMASATQGEEQFIEFARQAYRDASPLAHLIRHIRERGATHGNQESTRIV